MGRFRQFRSSGGRHRQTTLADIGMSCCDRCGCIFTPDLSRFDSMADPREITAARRTCPRCDGAPAPGDIFLQQHR
jgi:hypothetical protein